MCGLAGYLAPPGRSPAADVLPRMTCALAHRGPDGQRVWEDPAHGVGLGHRRLAIIDLSDAGTQPMWSATRRFVLVFNGEIYNYRRLASELAALGHTFRSKSDTEVLLAAVEHWGLQDAVARLVGIFAFALWDTRQKELHLVRDHLGVKPMYYGWVGGVLVFGSELKSLVAYPGFDRTVDRGALSLLLRHNCIPAPYTIYRSARKARPGTILTWRAGSPGDPPIEAVYWSALDAVRRGMQRAHSPMPDAEAVDALDALLRDAIELQMIADVPLGAFLSGGIDSSTVVALMQAQSTSPVQTFSIGSHVDRYDEAPHAREVARHLGTQHTELYVTPGEALDIIPSLPRFYDEPFSDASQIPTTIVSRLARRSVTVSLSGDGGDELFAGYNRHTFVPQLWTRFGRIPRILRQAAASAISAIPPSRYERILSGSRLLERRAIPTKGIGANLHKFAGVLGAGSPAGMYRALTSHWSDPASVVIDGIEPPTLLTDGHQGLFGSFVDEMTYLDLVTYLPDDILVKVDRASMAFALEARVPLLDHRVVEFAWALPLHQKVRDGRGKWILRRVLERYVPPTLTDRPKAGFGVPIDEWLRGPLRDWGESLLSEKRLAEEGYFRVAVVREAWKRHLSGAADLQYPLWDVLMFQAWQDAQQR